MISIINSTPNRRHVKVPVADMLVYIYWYLLWQLYRLGEYIVVGQIGAV